MTYYLAKTEPSTYSIDDLKRDQQTVWDGVRNPQAVKVLRSMRPGDRVLIYHSGGESAIAGLAEVAAAPRPDPKDPRSAVVDLRYRAHLNPPTLLKDVKLSGLFNDWALVRQGRLSTMAAPEEFIDWLRRRYPASKI